MFVAHLEGGDYRIEAAAADRCNYHTCPNCNERVLLAKGRMRRPHFRHTKDSICTFSGESWQHEDAKAAILKGARVRGLKAEPEVPVLSVEGDRRADVLVWAPETNKLKPLDYRRLAFEVQHSACDPAHLVNRTRAYMAAGVPVIWIPVVDQNKLKEIFKVKSMNLYCSVGYSTPNWIKQIASIHDKLWVYVPQTNGFWRAWLLPHWRYKNPTEGYDADGNCHSGGGYYFRAKIQRDLYLQGPFLFSELSILRVNQTKNKTVSPKGEAAYLVELLYGAKEFASQCPIQQRRERLVSDGVDTGIDRYVEWLICGDEEREACLEQVERLPVHMVN